GSSTIVQRAERVLGLGACDRRLPAGLAVVLFLLLFSGLLSLPRVSTGQAIRTVHTQVTSVRRLSGSPAETHIDVTVNVR
ncbi:MAG: hypothetical protein ACXWC3_27105, partial [Burkholderiales bacterium]